MTDLHSLDGSDAETVASLLVPDDTPQAALIELFDALDSAGFGIGHRDGYHAQNAVAYDLTSTDSRDDIVPDPGSPIDYDTAYGEIRTEILSGAAYEAAIDVLGAHMAAAVHHLVDGEAADPDFHEPDKRTIENAIKESKTQFSDDFFETVWNRVEVDV